MCASERPIEQPASDSAAAVVVVHRQRIQKHAVPVLQAKHGPNMIFQCTWKQGIAGLSQEFGRKGVGDAQDASKLVIDRHLAIAMGNRLARAGDANCEKLDRGNEWNDVLEQKLVQAASRETDEAGNVHAFAEMGGPVTRKFHFSHAQIACRNQGDEVRLIPEQIGPATTPIFELDQTSVCRQVRWEYSCMGADRS